jgi:RND family efflux transporter MFP subunit
MLFSKKIAALAASLVGAVSLVAIAQDGPTPGGSADQSRQIVVNGSIDWIEVSSVSALREGILESIEHTVGREVKKGDEIGKLHSEIAELTEAKAKIAAKNTGEIRKAEAQYTLAVAQVGRIQRLKKRGAGNVSLDEEEKAAADLSVAEAAKISASEQQSLAKADHDLALQTLKEHKIIAPFDGVITDKMKNPGESVRSNEAVVRIGRTNKLRFVGWIPLETAMRLKGNEVIDVRPVIEGSDLRVEDEKFRGKLTAISHEINAVRGSEVQVLAEIDNPPRPDHPELQLRQGMKADMIIYLDPAAPKIATSKK